MQIPNNRIPSIIIWDTIIDILNKDDYFCNTTSGKLYRKNNKTVAIYDRPLTSVEIVFSDKDLACGVWHDNTVSILNKNSMQYDKYMYYIDVASLDVDIIQAVRKNIILSREILYTIENNLDLKRTCMILPNIDIAPVEELEYNDNQILFVSTIKLNVETNSFYR